MAGNEKSKFRQMIDEYGIKNMDDVHEFVKMLTEETIQAAQDAKHENDRDIQNTITRIQRLPTAGIRQTYLQSKIKYIFSIRGAFLYGTSR